MPLDYLLFERSEPSEEVVSFDASATVTLARWPALQAELTQVLTWAWQVAGAGPGALDDGADWDLSLQGSVETSCNAQVSFAPRDSGMLAFVVDSGAPLERRTVHLALSFTSRMAEAFVETGWFEPDA